VTDAYEEQVPGVTLFLVNATESGGQTTEKFRVRVVLDASIHDESVWQELLTKFREGFRVSSSNDFHIEVLDVVRKELELTEARIAELARKLRHEQDARAQVERELERYKGPLTALGKVLNGR
jgi:regulator of protease activity HflC (stomatin/prohibitin superfamily)